MLRRIHGKPGRCMPILSRGRKQLRSLKKPVFMPTIGGAHEIRGDRRPVCSIHRPSIYPPFDDPVWCCDSGSGTCVGSNDYQMRVHSAIAERTSLRSGLSAVYRSLSLGMPGCDNACVCVMGRISAHCSILSEPSRFLNITVILP